MGQRYLPVYPAVKLTFQTTEKFWLSGCSLCSKLAESSFVVLLQVSYNTLVQQQQRAAESYDNPSSYVPYGPDALSVALLPAFLARYTPPSVATAHTNKTSTAAAAAKPSTQLTPVQVNASTAAAKVVVSSKLTNASSGLLYYTLEGSSSSFTPSPSVSLNAWAVWITKQVSGAGTAAASRNTLDSLAYAKQIRNASTMWRAVVASQLVKNADAARKPSKLEFRPINEPLNL